MHIFSNDETASTVVTSLFKYDSSECAYPAS